MPTPLELPELGADGWSVWSFLPSCVFAYVSELEGDDASGVLYGAPTGTVYPRVHPSSDPIAAPFGQSVSGGVEEDIKPFRTAMEALTRLFDTGGLGPRQFALLFRRAEVYRGPVAEVPPFPATHPRANKPFGSNIRRSWDTSSGFQPDLSFQFTGPTTGLGDRKFYEFPILLGAYGDPAKERPVLDVYLGNALALLNGQGTSNIMMRSLHVRAPIRLPELPEYDAEQALYQTLTAATSNNAIAAIRAEAKGPLRVDLNGVLALPTYKANTRVLERMSHHITIEDCLFQGLCGGITNDLAVQDGTVPVGEGNEPGIVQKDTPPVMTDEPTPRALMNIRQRWWRINRCQFDRIYVIPSRPGRSDGRTNICTMYWLQSWEMLDIAQRYIGWLPDDPRTERTFFSQGVYSHQHHSTDYRIEGVLAYKGCLTAIQVRGGTDIVVRNIAASNLASAIEFGHVQSNYDVEGQRLPVIGAYPYGSPLLSPQYMSFDAKNMYVEAPDDLTLQQSGSEPVDNVRGFGVTVFRFHKANLTNVLCIRGENGVNNVLCTSTGARVPLTIAQLGKPFGCAPAEACTIRNVVVHDYCLNLGGHAVQFTNATQDGGNPKPIALPASVTLRDVRVKESLRTGAAGNPNILMMQSPLTNYATPPGGTHIKQNYDIPASLTSFSTFGTQGPQSFADTLVDLNAVGGTVTLGSVSFPNSTKNMGSYADVVCGITGTEAARKEAFFKRATLEMRLGNWDARYTAKGLIDWVFPGYGLVP